MTDRYEELMGRLEAGDKLTNAEKEELLMEAEIRMEIADARLKLLRDLKGKVINERRWWRVSSIVSIVAAGIGITLGAFATVTLLNYLHDVDQRRITSCKDDAEDAVQANKGVESDVSTLQFIGYANVSGDSAEEKAQIKVLVDFQTANIRKGYQRVRSCTPEDIKDWNDSGREQGYVDGPGVALVPEFNPNQPPPIPGL
jgi:hypothetical protein